MTIKSQGGVFGRNPTFNAVETDSLTASTADINGDFTVDTDTLFVDAANNRVGIGTISPGGSLHVEGSGASPITLTRNGGTDANTSIQWKQATTSWYAGVNSANSFAFKYNSADLSTNNALVIGSDGNVSLATGNLVLTNGKGIDFSATSGTGTSELFDDYEEGTWTGTYGTDTATGTYTKIGRAVYIDILLSANSASFSTITGLPYTCGSGGYSGGFTWGRVFRMDTLDANGVPCRISVSGTTINFTTNVATGGDAAFTVTSDASGTVRAGLSGVYYV